MDKILDGLTISAMGLCGVFLVLIIFFASTKLMMFLANKYSKPDDNH